jgi:hypothetical protein
MAGRTSVGAWARRIVIAACGWSVVASCSSPPSPEAATSKPAPPMTVDRQPPTTPVEVAVAPSPEPAKPAPAPAFAPRFDPPRPTPPNVEPTVRVRVGTRLRTPQSFACPGGEFTVSRGNERWTAAAPLRVAATAAGWQVTAKGSARSFAAGPLELRPIGKASIEWDGAGWYWSGMYGEPGDDIIRMVRAQIPPTHRLVRVEYRPTVSDPWEPIGA